MSLARESVCDALNLKMVDDAATSFIAANIIELSQRGIRDVATLRRKIMSKEFKRED
jgi:hypothetical protein